MPLNKDIKKVLVIGSGPIIIGQAAEFDYSGTQACRAIKEDNIEIVLINSNPATIMTDSAMADSIYIEPLTVETVERIIEKEKPDSILSGLGGQTGLNICMELAKSGFLEKTNVKLLGASYETIQKAEDRKLFKEAMESINQPTVQSDIAENLEDAMLLGERIGFPVIVRPAFTLGGSGGGIASNAEELEQIASTGLLLSPINQILIEKCVAGWKEIEFEIIRDGDGNKISVCSMENFDPVGIHTGDSIVIAPAVTLADKEYQMLRSAALNIAETLGIEGGCNCQFALNPNSFEYAVIEVNPRVSRSSALASKATGYPIAKVAAKIALGYRLDEILNKVTGKSSAAFEPALDYVTVKMPKWPFDKFGCAKRKLGTQMKATGEIMAISDSFESAIMKAVRGAELGTDTLSLKKFEKSNDSFLLDIISQGTDERVFAIYEMLKRGIDIEQIHAISKIDIWFLCKLKNLCDFEKSISGTVLSKESYFKGKKLGFTDTALERISENSIPNRAIPLFKTVDTCAGEFAAQTPYFYSIYDVSGDNDAKEYIEGKNNPVIAVIGSGPIRIGQGIEFDYSAVHCVNALKSAGYDVIIINNNPETVSTDFDTADRLYFEPLTGEDVMNVIELEKPIGVIIAFGGQTAIKLAKTLDKNGVKIIGTSSDGIDLAEDRERFDELLEELGIKRPSGMTVFSESEALYAANTLGYPVLVRPSYVLGGQNMNIAFNDVDLRSYMNTILSGSIENPVLIDKYLKGIEAEVDAICDGENILIPGIMEHIEKTGVHSGDSIAVYPPLNIDEYMRDKICTTTEKICKKLNAVGLVNLQYIIIGKELYVIEVNPRASRTVPYMSKVTGIPMCDCAVRASLGESLTAMGFGTGIYKTPSYTAVKVPIFSFEKLDIDTQLGPEMKSTGEVLGIGKNLKEALFKGLTAAGYKMYHPDESEYYNYGVLLTVCDGDKPEIAEIAEKFSKMGFKLYATAGTAEVLKNAGLSTEIVRKIHQADENSLTTLTLIESGKVKYIVSTSANSKSAETDSAKIRRKAVMLGIPCLTCTDTANALADSLISGYNEKNTEIIDINSMHRN